MPAATGATTGHVLDVDERVDLLLLVVAGMWSLLQDTGLTDEQLEARMGELDEADGVADGKLTPRTTECANCGAAVSGELPACQFCGTPVPNQSPGPLTTV